MNRFTVEPAVFAQLPDYCVGVVVARGLDNHSRSEAVSRMLDLAAERGREDHRGHRPCVLSH